MAILLKKGEGGGLDPPGSAPDMGGQRLKVIHKLLTCSD